KDLEKRFIEEKYEKYAEKQRLWPGRLEISFRVLLVENLAKASFLFHVNRWLKPTAMKKNCLPIHCRPIYGVENTNQHNAFSQNRCKILKAISLVINRH
ncbi:MAG: hypothetical protein V4560_17225, partial [Bacteroidota bacterium]